MYGLQPPWGAASLPEGQTYDHTQVHPRRGCEQRSLDVHSDLWPWVLPLVAPQVIEFTSVGGLRLRKKKMPGN